MPELLTKHPDVTLQVLRGGGATCGAGQQQKILTTCRPDRFCSTATGEVCIYGLDEIHTMNQLSSSDLSQRICPAPATAGRCGVSAAEATEPVLFVALGALALGVLLARRARRSSAARER
jgi:MYXO-CTERM domain-containing protein